MKPCEIYDKAQEQFRKAIKGQTTDYYWPHAASIKIGGHLGWWWSTGAWAGRPFEFVELPGTARPGDLPL